MRVEDVMTKDVVTCFPDHVIRDAAVDRWAASHQLRAIAAASIAIAGLLSAADVGAAPMERTKSIDGSVATRSHMEGLVDSLKVLLPLTGTDERFGSSLAEPVVGAALAKLATHAGDLERHGTSEDASFAFLSRTLALDARRALYEYETDNFRTSRFLVQSSIETCVTCHSRLPGERRSRLGAELLANVDLEELHWQERARLQTATRRYDDALASYEAGLLGFPSAEDAVTDLFLSGVFEEYLELCLRAERDPARAEAALIRFALRANLPDRLRERVNTWLGSLRVLRGKPPEGDALTRSAFWMARAEERVYRGDDLPALVDYLAASSELHAFVESEPDATDISRAYLELARIESHIGLTAWISQAEALFEAAIRADPGSPTASEAFQSLSDFILAGYTGSAGENVPAEWRARLAELEVLALGGEGGAR